MIDNIQRFASLISRKAWGALLRGLLAVMVAVITSLIAGLTGHIATPILVLSACLQGAIALRAFIDTSNSKAAQAADDQEAQDASQNNTPTQDSPIVTPSWQQNLANLK